MNYDNLPKGGAQKEILSGEDEKLRRMLGNLRKIDAPKNFDFKLKARIAAGEPEIVRKPRIFPVLRIAAPFGLLALIFAFVIFNLFFSTGIAEVPQIADNFPAPPKHQSPLNNPAADPAVSAPPAPIIPKSETAAAIPVKNSAVSVSELKTPRTAPVLKAQRRNTDNEFLGTKDSALTRGKIIVARGLDQNQQPKPPENLINNTSTDVRQILSQIGIEGDFSDANWRVITVRQNSLAESSGVKNGDLIESIDDKKLAAETVFARTFSGKTLQLIRDGKKISVELKKP